MFNSEPRTDEGEEEENVKHDEGNRDDDENLLNEEKFLLKIECSFKPLRIRFVGIAREFVSGILQAQSFKRNPLMSCGTPTVAPMMERQTSAPVMM